MLALPPVNSNVSLEESVKLRFIFVFMLCMFSPFSNSVELNFYVSEKAPPNYVAFVPPLAGVTCNVYVGEKVQVIEAPAKISVYPERDDVLRVDCSKQGYVTLDVSGGLQSPYWGLWYDLHDAKCGFIFSLALGVGFVSGPLSLLTWSQIPIAINVGFSSLLFAYGAIKELPYDFNYTYIQRSIGIYLAKPENIGSREPYVFDSKANPNKPIHQCPV